MKRPHLVFGTLLLCLLLTGTSAVVAAPAPGNDMAGEPASLPEYIPPVPELSLTKTIVSPTGGVVVVGASVLYEITIEHLGGARIPEMHLVDAYDSPCFESWWMDATPPPDMPQVTGGVWNDLGSLDEGESLHVQVRLMAASVCAAAENRAYASLIFDEYERPVPPVGDQVSIQVVSGFQHYLPLVNRKLKIIKPPW